MKQSKVLLLFICVLFIHKGAFSDEDAKVLKGIDSVRIMIENLPESATKMGITYSRLRTIVELRLRREGITIITGRTTKTLEELGYEKYIEELEKLGNTPWVYVDLSVVGMAFHIELVIHESVILRRDKSIGCIAITWNNSTTGTHANDPEFIVSCLGKLLDVFLNDYYKANPKKID